ncbi:MAG: CidA/LrgA family protein [Eubacterium sp.]|nr:CidA/LrgA family protein [Eubacterium sp.]
MKHIRQFLIILLFCFLGELLKYLIPLPIPTSIYGLVLMLTALLTGILKVDQVDETAVFLIDIMPVMFIPAGVGLLTSIEALRPNLAAIAVITILTTVLVMGITGITAQFIMERKKDRDDKEVAQ